MEPAKLHTENRNTVWIETDTINVLMLVEWYQRFGSLRCIQLFLLGVCYCRPIHNSTYIRSILYKNRHGLLNKPMAPVTFISAWRLTIIFFLLFGHLLSPTVCLIVSTPSSIFLCVRTLSPPMILDPSQLIPSPHCVREKINPSIIDSSDCFNIHI